MFVSCLENVRYARDWIDFVCPSRTLRDDRFRAEAERVVEYLFRARDSIEVPRPHHGAEAVNSKLFKGRNGHARGVVAVRFVFASELPLWRRRIAVGHVEVFQVMLPQHGAPLLLERADILLAEHVAADAKELALLTGIEIRNHHNHGGRPIKE